MISTVESLDAALIAPAACIHSSDEFFVNGLRANVSVCSFLYHYLSRFESSPSRQAYIYVEDSIYGRPLSSVFIDGLNVIISDYKGSENRFIMSHPWDIGSRFHSLLLGRLNTRVTIKEVHFYES